MLTAGAGTGSVMGGHWNGREKGWAETGPGEGIGGSPGGVRQKNRGWIWKYGKAVIIFAPVLTTSLIKKG
jgi:hypothetical protein